MRVMESRGGDAPMNGADRALDLEEEGAVGEPPPREPCGQIMRQYGQGRRGLVVEQQCVHR